MGIKKPPKTVKMIIWLLTRSGNREMHLGDLEEEYSFIYSEKGKLKANLWYLSQIFLPLITILCNYIFWSLTMFKNYLKIALRNIRNQKVYSFINISGLAAGLACCILTLLWVQYEFSYDNFHQNGDRIYRVIQQPGSNVFMSATPTYTPDPIGPELTNRFPEIDDYCRNYYLFYDHRVQYNEFVDFQNKSYIVDQSFFEIFDFEFRRGNPLNALDKLNSVVITEKTAIKYFGSEDPVGRNILFEDGKYVLEVTGIIKDIPENSQMYFDFILRLDALERIYSDWWKSDFTEWKDQNVMTYLMTSENFSQYEFEEKLNNYIKVNTEIPEREYFLQPLKKAHLYSDFPRDPANRGRININNIYFFLIISVSVLLIACINFMNLSTARSLKRSKEVGIRKVNGAQRRDLILQYMGESFFYTISALLLAFLLSVFLLPVLREFTGKQIDLSLINIWQFLGSTLIVIIITGFVSGIYPALFLSSFEPVKVMKGILNPRNSSFLKMRRFLLAFQFFCTISLLIITIIIYSQLDFIKNKDLGFQSKDIVSLGFNRELFNQCVPFKAELLKHPGIANVTSGLPPTNDVMGHGPPTKYDWEGKNPEGDIEFDFMFVDFGYDKVFELKMAEGRFYSQDHPGDLNMYVLNEAAIKAMKITNPIGKKFTMSKSEGEIIGVVKDFHTGTLKTKIKPTVFILRPNFGILVKFTPGDNGNAINYIEETWGEFVNEIPFDYDYIEDRLASFYSGDRKTWDMLRSFTILIFFISCMGLFGLISFVTEQKTKEIGIRKTFGASVSGIVGLISKEFFLLILIANCIAWPSAYFIISRWLQNFAYRIDPGWSVFMLSGLVVLMVTLLTIIYQTVKAATANPVDSIRYE